MVQKAHYIIERQDKQNNGEEQNGKKKKEGEVDLTEKNEGFVRRKFRDYYEKHPTHAPNEVASREFGFGSWEKKIEARHFSFMNEKELNGYLARNAPFFISYSAAKYRYPAARPIQRKEWLGAELIFDIDANEMPTSCKHGKDWICEKCMNAAKESLFRLVDFLTDDFGVDKSEIRINFSGNRGYHLHVNENFLSLGGYARREIADYVNGRNISYNNIFQEKGRKVIGPKQLDGGWKGRIAKTFIKGIKNTNLENLGVHPRIASKFYGINAADYIGDGNWERVYISNRKKFFQNLIETITSQQGCHVDEQVTMDVSKLIRLPDSIHGETGMTAKTIQPNNLEKFNPFSDPIIFSNKPTKVHIKKCGQFILNDQTFGAFKDQTIDLPEHVAIYLICKKAADLA